MIYMSILDEVINQASIKDMLEYYGVERQSTGLYLCPFHNDTHASLSVTPDDKFWKCFTCGEQGNIDNLVEKMERSRGNDMDYRHRIDFIIKLQNLNIEFSLDNGKTKQLTPEEKRRNRYFSIMKDAKQIALNCYTDDKKHHGKASRYLAGRGISDNTIKVFEIGYNNKSMLQDNLLSKYSEDELFQIGILAKTSTNEKYYDFQYDRILIPIKDSKGNTVAFGGRSLDKNPDFKYKNTKTTDIFKKSNILFNYNLAKREAMQKQEIVIVEGYFDVISAYEMGLKNTVALMGVELSEEHKKLLKEIGDDVSITLCLDNDDAGRKAMCKIIPELVAEGYDVNILDTSILNIGKDMNDLLINGITPSDLEKIKIPAVDFLFSYSFDFYKKKQGKVTIDTVRKVYDAVFKNEQFNNSFNEVKFIEYVSNKYGYTRDDITSACHPTNNSTLLSLAMQQVFCGTIKSILVNYAEKTDNRILQQFLAQNRLTINHIMQGMNSPDYIQNNGRSINVPKFCNEYLLNTNDYKEFEKTYDKDFDRLLNNVYGLDKSGNMVKIFLDAKQKDIILNQYNSSFENDIKTYFKKENDRFVKMFVADSVSEFERMLGKEYALKSEALADYNKGNMAFINYGAKFTILDIERLSREQPLEYTNANGDKFQLVFVFNNSNNQLNLQPENYISNVNGLSAEDKETINEDELPNNLPPIRERGMNRRASINNATVRQHSFPTQPNE